MVTKKTIEERYKKKSQLEHILDRPDSYIGSIEMTDLDEPMWVVDKKENDNGDKENTLVKKNLKIVPGLYKIFDEILVNAGDQWVRTKQAIDDGNSSLRPVKNIKVEIDEKENIISVYNDGEGIDIALHKEHNMYVPQLLFGELLTSENYDDNETERLTGGKNGYGSKLTNIFSTEFTIETVDGNRKLKYIQKFKNNMSEAGKPKITKYSSRPYTKVSFKPDLEKFGMTTLDSDIVSLMKKRVYDLTAYTDKSVNVYLDGERLQTKMFEKYVDLYLGSKTDRKRVYCEFNSRWEIVATVSPDDKFEHVSFVNGICTYKGGKHVDYIANQIAKKMLKYLQSKGGSKNKEMYANLKTANIKDNLWIFVKAQINMPSFSSQTKEEMTTAVKNFGSKCDIDDDFIKKLCKTKILDKAMMLSQYKQKSNISKNDGKKKTRLSGIPKLDDANWAGTSKSQECTLILTEGDSAKALAVAGLSVVGSNKFGVFPLKGKLINPRGSSLSKNMKNEELINLKKILGLQMYEPGTSKPKVYKDTSQLRYGHIMIFTDQDLDGSHIKGLVINMFAYYWPSLLEIDGFIQTLATPIIKVKGKGKNPQVKSFYTLYDYENWKKELGDDADKKWHKPKYFKGLGTSTKQDAREYFSRYDEDIVKFYPEKKEFNKEINLAFEQKGDVNGKSYADLRKKWLLDYDHSRVLDMKEKNLSYTRFIHDDLIHFSNYDNIRAIPSICDGLKPSQRKVLYGVFKRNLVSEIKVAQLGGYVSEQSAYHHGEASLFSTIIGMAQDYVGSNNINLLQPNGQFGTRAMGGKDSASPRYIFTQMSKITRKIFNKEDDEILKYIIDDGQSVEPEYYMPSIPMILVNGANGIGTGYSTSIPPFKVADIIHNLKVMLYKDDTNYKNEDDTDNEDDNSIIDISFYENYPTEYVDMMPYYKGFKGSVEKTSDNKYQTVGVFERTNDTTVTVTELPIGIWTQNYKEHLEKLQSDETVKVNKKTGKVSKSKKTKELLSYTNNLGLDVSKSKGRKSKSKNKKSKGKKNNSLINDEDDMESINITLKFSKTKLDKFMKDKDKFMNTFKLVEAKSTKTTNMYLFDENNKLKKYKSAFHILEEYYGIRIQFYKKRYNHLLSKLKYQKNILREKIRFIKGIINNDIDILRKSDEEILDIMIEHDFMKISNNDDNDVDNDESTLDMYKYLIDMPIRSLTKNKLKELRQQHKARKEEYKSLLKKSPKILWLDDLNTIEKCL